MKKHFVPPPARRWRFRLRRGSRSLPLLFAFFATRFEHLIARCFLYAFNHEMLSNRFLFLSAGPRNVMTLGTGDDAPFLGHLCVIRRFLRGDVVFFAHSFMARLCP